MKRVTSGRTFKRFLISYLLILMIPVLIGVYAYDKTVEILEDDAKEANLSVLNQSRETLDIRLREVEQIATDLALNPKVLYLQNVTPPFSNQDYYLIYEVLNDIKKYNLNQFVSDYYLHFPGSSLLITRRSMYELPNAYGIHFRYGELDYEQWLERFKFDGRLNRYFGSADIYYDGMHPDMITLQKSIFPGNVKEGIGSVFVTFPEEEIRKMFDHLLLNEGGWAYILDERGEVIYGTDPDQAFEGRSFDLSDLQGDGYTNHVVDDKKMFISYTTSSSNNWKYIAAIPYNTVVSKANYIKRITWTVALLSVAIGILAAFMLARRNSKPIREMVETFRDFMTGDNGTKGSDYDFIQGSLTQLILNHKRLKTSYDEQLPFLRASFFNRLFRGEFKDARELAALSAQLGLAIPQKPYVVLTLRLSGYDGLFSNEILEEIGRNKIAVRSVAERLYGDRALIGDTHDDRLSMLLGSAAAESEAAEGTAGADAEETEAGSASRLRIDSKIERLRLILRKEADISVQAGIGGVYDHLPEIWKSYDEAQRALEYGARVGREVFWHAELPMESHIYYFPLDLEMRMIHSVKSGNREGLEQIFGHVEEMNFRQRKLTEPVIRQLLQEISGAALKILEPMPDAPAFDEAILRTDPKSSVMQEYERIKQSILNLCASVEKEKKDQSVQLINRMIDYIEANYADCNISLAGLAAHFNLSESYSSTFFKEQTGENFSVFLETLRMKEACRLLAHTKQSVNEIALRIGYNSDKAFRRAFKRCTGVLPTDYRNMDNAVERLPHKQ